MDYLEVHTLHDHFARLLLPLSISLTIAFSRSKEPCGDHIGSPRHHIPLPTVQSRGLRRVSRRDRSFLPSRRGCMHAALRTIVTCTIDPQSCTYLPATCTQEVPSLTTPPPATKLPVSYLLLQQAPRTVPHDAATVSCSALCTWPSRRLSVSVHAHVNAVPTSASRVIPRGTHVSIPPYVPHRDARNLIFPDRFWPERWLVTSGQLASRVRTSTLRLRACAGVWGSFPVRAWRCGVHPVLARADRTPGNGSRC